MTDNPYPHLSTTFEELSYRHHNGLEARDPQRNVFEIVAPEGKTVHLGLTRVFMAAPDMLGALELAAWLIEEAIEVHIYGDDETPDPECNYTQGLATIRAAIAKAKGGAA
jgi:hypothetical protein